MTAEVDEPGAAPVLHAAAVYESEATLLSRAGPFLRAGLDRGDVVLAMVPPRVQEVLRAAPDGDWDRVQWREVGLDHRGVGEAFDEFDRILAACSRAGEPARLLTENDLADGPDRLAAYLRFEAASTELLAPYGYPWACLYDRLRHSEDMLAHIGEVHPQLIGDDGGAIPSRAYVDPAAYLTAHPGPLSPVPEPPDLDVELTSPDELAALRRWLLPWSGPRTERRDDQLVLVAVGEVATNALLHGRPPCRVRAWSVTGVRHVRVDDHGHHPGLATAGYRRSPTATRGGMGLWVARRLADVVHTQAGPTGTAVELQFR